MFIRHRKKGFTIIELLIVISVIAILVGIALPRFKGMKDEANIAKAKGELTSIQAAVESYWTHHSNVYPANIAAALTGAVPQILAVVPYDPFGATSTTAYGYVTAGQYYVIFSAGPNGNGTVSVTDAGVLSETNGASCIYVSNAGSDTAP